MVRLYESPEPPRGGPAAAPAPLPLWAMALGLLGVVGASVVVTGAWLGATAAVAVRVYRFLAGEV